MDPHEKFSRMMTYLLRHGARKEGLQMRQDGFSKVADVLQNKCITKIGAFTHQDVKDVVAKDAKQRYNLQEFDGELYIRANQGHSLKEVEVELKKISSLDDIPSSVVIHGTYIKFWDSIKRTGLKTMGRKHVHFSIGEIGDRVVISGMRTTCDMLVYLDVEKCLLESVPLWLSANNVVLSEGIGGVVPPTYFKYVLRSKDRQPFDPDFPNHPNSC
eukprot:TRINITY_DN547_c0_g1_i1.p1 TRINITY_DN547_c0_g1~~TRINITY_DN547_c0_g1_i1.p1  ORF type:complete len:249 (-),score=45.33 TRINITY_DN547_c0_g1_i1:111-755(-)